MGQKTARLFEANRRVIPGGVVSLNRVLHRDIAFERGKGSRIWDVEGNEYIDYNMAFSVHVLGHNDDAVNTAVIKAIQSEQSLFGAGTTPWEGEVARRIVDAVPSVEKVQITNTGSEATYHALRIARSHTGRDDIIVIQGGYNGWHNDVAANLMTPADVLGARRSPGEYPFIPITAGIPSNVGVHVHAVNFNDLESMEYVMQRHPIAAVIMEPILQNIGVLKPLPGYLEGVRRLCDREGVVLVFDEVKTGFRYALGGYQSICGVKPDLSTFGKAISNGYPMGVIGGKAELMDYFTHQDPAKRVMIAGTYNAHPVSCAAGVATIDKLAADGGRAHETLDGLGRRMVDGLRSVLDEFDVPNVIERQGSAFCTYFMDHSPRDWHDLLANHDASFDLAYRKALIDRGVFQFPIAMKQGSLSLAHTTEDIDITLEKTRDVLKHVVAARPA
jgi:glutamate-1-semialdehyde 2,1-aminomutase